MSSNLTVSAQEGVWTRLKIPAGHIRIHAAPVILQDGDVYDQTVNLASRLASVAQAGEVVISPEVAHRAEGVRLDDMVLSA